MRYSLDYLYGMSIGARFGGQYAVVHRATLFGSLLAACHAHRNDVDSVRCMLSSGSELPADGVIGADGIHSKLRGQLVGDGAPRPSGHTLVAAGLLTQEERRAGHGCGDTPVRAP